MRNRPSVLTWIIAFKVVKTTILTAVGVGVLTVRHADPVDVLLRLALAFHLPLTSRLLNRLLSSVSNLTLPKETAFAMTAFAYAILMGSEGVSLYVKKSWARWFTIIATSSLIPLELYEIAQIDHDRDIGEQDEYADRVQAEGRVRIAGPTDAVGAFVIGKQLTDCDCTGRFERDRFSSPNAVNDQCHRAVTRARRNHAERAGQEGMHVFAVGISKALSVPGLLAAD